mgnify:FL=1|jgi:transcriptional regulator with XRE-family HTH domain
MEDIILRIKQLMKYYELNISETAQKIGISQPNLSAMLSGKRPIGGNIINKFIISFGINKDWLESGQGEMYDLDTRRLGTRMFIIRNERKWTSQETADYLKIPLSEYQKIESGKNIPDKNIIDKFIYISNANPSWVYNGMGKEFEDDYYECLKQQKSDKISHKSIISRIEALMESANISFSELAIRCKVSHTELADFFNSENSPIGNKIDVIASSIGANKDWILTGLGSPFENESPLANECAKTFESIFGTPNKKTTRPRVPLTAAAGSLSGDSIGVTLEQCEQMPLIHQIPSYDFTMFIKGDSMSPRFESGDEIACRHIDQSRFIQWCMSWTPHRDL